MREIHAAIGKARGRLMLGTFLVALVWFVSAGVASLLVTRVVERVFGLGHLFGARWWTIAGATIGACVLLAVAWTLVRRPRALVAARRLDEGADLKEVVSTALLSEKSEDAWARAVVESARARVAGVDVSAALPVAAPRAWWMPLALGVALMVVWMTLPVMDVLGLFKKEQRQAEQQRQIQAVREDLLEKQKKLDELLARANVKMESGESEGEGLEGKLEAVDPEALNRAMMKRLTETVEKLRELKSEEKGEAARAMKDAMRSLRTPPAGPLDDFSRALMKADFARAGEALSAMNEKLASESLSGEEQKQLEEQVRNLREQLKKIAENRRKVESALEKAGMDPEAAKKLAEEAMKDPEAIKRALEQIKDMPPEQLEQLMKQAGAAAAASRQAGQMGEGLGQMGEGLGGEGLSQEMAEGMQDLQEQLSDLEMAQNELQNIDAAMREAQQQLGEVGQGMCQNPGQGQGEGQGQGQGEGEGNGEWAQGEPGGEGQGVGGPGRGKGDSPEAVAADYTVEKRKSASQTTGGPMIGSRLVQGQQVRGEARQEFSSVVESARREAAEAMENNVVRRELHDVVKSYFGRLEAQGKGQGAAPAKKPAGEKKPD